MIQGKIEDIAFGGDGVLRKDGFVVFVPFTALGDVVDVEFTKKKKTHAFGKAVNISEKGPFRRDPICPLFEKCGGCQFQHINYEQQLEIKRTFIQEALKRIGKISLTVPPVHGASFEWGYRKHIRLHLKRQEKGFSAGFFAQDNTSLLKVEKCALFTEDPILERVQGILQNLQSEQISEGSLRILKTEENTYLLAFEFAPHFPMNHEILRQEIGEQITGIYIKSGSEHLCYGKPSLNWEIEGLKLRFSPYGFLQNFPEQSAVLYRAILKNISSSCKNVIDLYSGIGITTLLLGRNGKRAIGIESHAESVSLSQENAQVNMVANVEFLSGKAEKLLPILLKDFAPDAILMNPPRTGLDPSLIPVLVGSQAKELIYVSCMPATLARDIKELCAHSYQVESVEAFDMFPQTTHVETLVKLKRL